MKIKIEFNGYEISDHKYRLIYRGVRRSNEYSKVSKEALERKIDDALFADWNNRNKHQEWIKTAPIDEIVNWLLTVMN